MAKGTAKQRYNIAIRILHKLVALCIILQFIIGFFFDSLFANFHPSTFMMLHKSIGLSTLILVLLLILIRLVSKKLPYGNTLPKPQIFLAKVVHFGMYICIILMSLSGFIASQLFQYPFWYFNLVQIPVFLPHNAALGAQIFSLHPIIAYILLVLVILHILAVIYHRFIVKDSILKRIW